MEIGTERFTSKNKDLNFKRMTKLSLAGQLNFCKFTVEKKLISESQFYIIIILSGWGSGQNPLSPRQISGHPLDDKKCSCSINPTSYRTQFMKSSVANLAFLTSYCHRMWFFSAFSTDWLEEREWRKERRAKINLLWNNFSSVCRMVTDNCVKLLKSHYLL